VRIVKLDIKKQSNKILLKGVFIAPSLNWKNISLMPVPYSTPPDDGIQEFILKATPPKGYFEDNLELFELSAKVSHTDWFKGARVKVENNDECVNLYDITTKLGEIGADNFNFKLIGVKGDKLVLNTFYSGGCKPHFFRLDWDGLILESSPIQIKLELSHHANNDICKALVSTEIQFDLSKCFDLNQDINFLIKGGGNEYVLKYKK